MSDTNTATETPTKEPMPLSTVDIMKVLAHRYPLLLVDKILEIVPQKRIVGLKNVTANEPFFTGHFPEVPIMPGVLVLESMAQTGGVLLMREFPDRNEKLVVFTGVERAKFRRPVVPGDQLRLEVDVLVWRHSAGKMQGRAFVDGKLACEATISCQVVPRSR